MEFNTFASRHVIVRSSKSGDINAEVQRTQRVIKTDKKRTWVSQGSQQIAVSSLISSATSALKQNTTSPTKLFWQVNVIHKDLK
ncbi:MAG: hypothetical protein H8D23_19185 [Candidatus Brocadiales bacterium]|nr:hypothetical protein [Candidatus Brocadiales bacterium]